MAKFEILCVTTKQNDFSKLKDMNVHSDIVFANQDGRMAYDEITFDSHTAKMITTNTKGVGINRNVALSYASADICLFADDDVKYVNDLEQIVLKEFDEHPEADVFFFNFHTIDPQNKRKQRVYHTTRRCRKLEPKSWGGCQIAVRLSSVRRANITFTTLFGGGCMFPSGEDSIWILEAQRKGLKLYISKEVIGETSFAESSWFTGFDERLFYGKGAFCCAMHKYTFPLWVLYFCFRTRKKTSLTYREIAYWMNAGRMGFQKMVSYDDLEKQLERGRSNDR